MAENVNVYVFGLRCKYLQKKSFVENSKRNNFVCYFPVICKNIYIGNSCHNPNLPLSGRSSPTQTNPRHSSTSPHHPWALSSFSASAVTTRTNVTSSTTTPTSTKTSNQNVVVAPTCPTCCTGDAWSSSSFQALSFAVFINKGTFWWTVVKRCGFVVVSSDHVKFYNCAWWKEKIFNWGFCSVLIVVGLFATAR